MPFVSVIFDPYDTVTREYFDTREEAADHIMNVATMFKGKEYGLWIEEESGSVWCCTKRERVLLFLGTFKDLRTFLALGNILVLRDVTMRVVNKDDDDLVLLEQQMDMLNDTVNS